MVIDIARDFSAYPSGRVPEDGTYSGEAFRRDVLVPAIEKIEKSTSDEQEIIVDIDGVRSFGSSFLEEAFGGLVRERNVDMDKAHKLIKIRCTKSHLLMFKDAIEKHLSDALKKSKTFTS